MAEKAGRRSPFIEHGHRRPEPCEGDDENHTGQGGIHLRRRSSHYD